MQDVLFLKKKIILQNIFDKNKAISSSILDKNKAGAATRKHAYLLFHLQNYYANLVEEENYPKFYFSDNGIVSLFLDRKETVQLENMAALALVRVSGRGVLPEIRQDRN
ncbi:hypothetical protein [Ruthenibacterium lactatiformans]|uniref:hypothetical protein n=1 Tax=Ruthenibacterium lactatiformans TaxID=1550024 RepID=UPI0026DD39B2|nr:hypothetical protein [Ruthenibacterium lactatiformans]